VRRPAAGYNPTIRIGYNNAGQEHEIHEAFRPPYFCRRCDQRLELRRGSRVRDYFAHWRNALDRDCPLLQQGGDDVQFETTRRSSIAHATDRLRLFIRVDGYQNEGRLYGVLPAFTADDLDEENIVLASAGTTRHVQISDLAPANAQGWIELLPDQDQYEVHIRPESLTIGGRWRAKGTGPGGFFVGDEHQAEYVYDPKRVTSGDWLYVPAMEEAGPPGATQLRIGEEILYKMRANGPTLNWLKQRVPDLRVDEDPLRVDILLPFAADVNAQTSGVIQGPAGSTALLAIVPPHTNDPLLELYPIPFREGAMKTVPHAGLGKIRFIELTIDPQKARRLLIHWPGRKGRDVTLDIAPTEANPVSAAPSILAFGVRIRGQPLLHAVHEPTLEVKPILMMADGPVAPNLELVCPDRYAVELLPEFLDAKGGRINRSEGSVNADQFDASIKDILARGPEKVTVRFPGVGTIELRTPVFHDHIRRQEEERRRHQEREAQDRNAHLEAQRRKADQQRAEQAAAQVRRKAEQEAEAARIQKVNEEKWAQLEKARREKEQVAREERERKRQEALDKDRVAVVERNLRSPSFDVPRHISYAAARRLAELPEETPKSELTKWRSIARKLQKQLRRDGLLAAGSSLHESSDDEGESEPVVQPPDRATAPERVPDALPRPADRAPKPETTLPGTTPKPKRVRSPPKPRPASKPDSVARKKLDKLRRKRSPHHHKKKPEVEAKEPSGPARILERKTAAVQLEKLAKAFEAYNGPLPTDAKELVRVVLGTTDEDYERMHRYYAQRLGNIITQALRRAHHGGSR
jgi:hypothetical protein